MFCLVVALIQNVLASLFMSGLGTTCVASTILEDNSDESYERIFNVFLDNGLYLIKVRGKILVIK